MEVVPVTTAWSVLGISSRGQPTRGGLPDWGLREGLSTPNRKNQLVTQGFGTKAIL
jgi:hypothetical protein